MKLISWFITSCIFVGQFSKKRYEFQMKSHNWVLYFKIIKIYYYCKKLQIIIAKNAAFRQLQEVILRYKAKPFKTNCKKKKYINNGSCFLCLRQITNLGKTTVLSTYNIQATYVNPTILRINFPTNSRSSSGNTWGNGFYISLSYDAKHFGDSLVMIIYNDVCYSCNASTLACTNTVTKHTGRFSTMKIFHNNSIYSKWILFLKMI